MRSKNALLNIALELDPVGSKSTTSYPWLSLARSLGVRYGDVLTYVNYLDQTRAGDIHAYRDCVLQQACTRLSPKQINSIRDRYFDVRLKVT